MTHDLKTWPEFFDPLLKGEKRFELRREDDRVFHVGDTLRLREWSPESGYTGREVCMDVTYLLSGPRFGLGRGNVCMSLVPSNDKLSGGGEAVPSNGVVGLSEQLKGGRQ